MPTFTSRRANLALLALVFLALALPRWAALSRAATADEAKWSARSANFLAALGRGDLTATYQSEHPGVTTMWAGALGLALLVNDYANFNPGQVELDQIGPFLQANHGRSALDALAAGRAMMVLLNALTLTLAFVYARLLFGLPTALLGLLLIAFSPFFAAHTHLLHLDGLAASLLLLALLAYLTYAARRRPADLFIAGITAGLSWLTKTPALFLLPFLAALTLWQLFQARHNGRAPLFALLWPFLALCAIGAVTFILLWPAMWVAPLGTLRNILGGALGYAAEGHGDPVFFNSRIYPDGRIPARVWTYYPLTYLWRATPLVLAGLPLAVLAFYRRWSPFDQPRARQTAVILLLFALSFTLFMNFGDKKFDRYLLPAYPPLALLAAAGWSALSRPFVVRASSRSSRHAPLVLLTLVAALQLASLLTTAPYYLSYYNPLLGGSRRAPQVMQVGWGEGLDEAGRYLRAKPDAANLTVASWYRSSFAYYFDGPTLSIKADPTPAEQAAIDDADYAVIYIHQWQRDLPPDLLTRLAALEPEHTISLNGLEYVRIYQLRP